MLNLKPYKGYTGYVKSLDPDTNLFHGRTAGLDATIVTFEAATPVALQFEFEASVDSLSLALASHLNALAPFGEK